MRSVLFYNEESRFASQTAWLDKHAGYYGFDSVYVVDRTGKWKSSHVYPSLQAAMSAVPSSMSWVWLDHRGSTLLDEFKHPEDNVIYAVGSDLVGFDGKQPGELPGTAIRLRDTAELFAAMVLPMVLYDRFLYLSGRRK